MRGLKPNRELAANLPAPVAPYVGAWIETQLLDRISDGSRVAPYVGAWIETINSSLINIDGPSHPTWVRGLKLIKKLS